MDLPEPVLQSYRQHFLKVRATAGSSLHSVLDHYGVLNEELWRLLNRVVDWRTRSSETLLEPDRFVAAYWGVRSDVQNGGFHQYFANSAGDQWPDLLRLLVLGGDTRGEHHFRRVLAFFPDSSPNTDRLERDAQLMDIDGSRTGNFANPFEALDSEYYSVCFYPDDETLFQALKSLNDVEFVPDAGF